MKKKFHCLLFFSIITNFFYDNYALTKDDLYQAINDAFRVTISTGILIGGLIIFKEIYNDIQKYLKKKPIKKIIFSDIGGYKDIKEKLLDIVNEAKDPNNEETNMTCILLYGPPGTGKTYFVRALANESNINFTMLDAADIHSSPYYGEAENNLKNTFKNVKKNAPSILFIDEIDNLLSHRGQGAGSSQSLYDDLKNLFLIHMDGTQDMNGVILIGATNNMPNMDPAFLRSGRFENKLFIGLPNYQDRLEIIKINLKKHKIIPDNTINTEYMAKESNNLSGADFNNLFKNIKQLLKKNKKTKFNIDIFNQELNAIKLQKLSTLQKSTTPKKIYFSDIGGYKEIKEELLEIINDTKNIENKNTNMTCILLQGPPGTGKTYIAQALANESKLPIFILDSTDILSSSYIGEAEKQVKLIFEKAKENSPCIFFIDEIDALLSPRNEKRNSSSENNIKNLLLSYIDGVHEMNGVTLIGATNNISNIEPAFLRSGRFEHQFFINIPNYEDRLEIIKINLDKNELNTDPKVTREYMAEETNTLSAADLNFLFKQITKLINKKNKKIPSNKKMITLEMFNKEVEKIKSKIIAEKERDLPIESLFLNLKNLVPQVQKIFNIP
jgi:transitional endoplasmic reticulum ATPase